MEKLNKSNFDLWLLYKKHVEKVVLNYDIAAAEKVSHWRNKVFSIILTYLTPLSIVALVPSVIMAFNHNVPVVGIVDLIAFATIVKLTIVPGIKIEYRKGIFIFMLYCLSFTLLYFLPVAGPGLLFSLTVTIFASLIYSTSAAYLSAWTNTALCIFFGLIIYLQIDPNIFVGYNLGAWVAVSSNLILLSFACAKCLDILLAGLTTSFEATRISEKNLEKANRQYQFISQINQTIVHVKDEETLFRNSCKIALDSGKYYMAWIGVYDIQKNKIIIRDASGLTDDATQELNNIATEINGPQDHVLRTGNYFLCNNNEQTTENERWINFTRKFKIRSCISLPIKKSGSVIGTFNLYSTEINYFDDVAIASLTEVTGDISFALDLLEKSKRHKEAEALLLHNEKRFRVLIEKSLDMKTLATAEGKLTYASPAITKVLGYEIEEFLNLSVFDLIHPEDIPILTEKIQSLLTTPGKSFSNTHRLLHKNKKWIWCEGMMTNMLHESGIESLVSNFRDVSAKKEAEMEAQKNFAELEAVSQVQSAILNTLPASIALLDNVGNIVKVNNEWIHFGKANGLISTYPHLNKNYIEISENSLGREANDGKFMAAGLKELLNGERDYFSMEYPCDSPTEKRWFKAEVRPFISNNLAGAVVMHFNISERKNAESELLLLINNTAESFILLNKSLHIISFNNQFKNLYKEYYSIELKKGDSILNYVQEERKEIVNAIYKKVLKGHVEESEISVVDSGNTTKHFLIKYNPAKDDSGEVFGVFVTAIDVTDKKVAETLKEFERRDKEALINSTDDLIWSVTKDLKLIAANNAFVNELKKYTGVDVIPGTELLKQEIFPPDYISHWKSLYNRAYAGESFKIEIYTPATPGRNESWTETSFSPIFFNQQIDGIACYSRNITERKIAELVIRASEARLAEAQSIAKIGNWETNLLTNNVLWSEQTYRIFDCNADEFDGTHPGFLSFVHPDDRSKVDEAFNKSYTKKSVNVIEHRIVSKKGAIKFLEEHWQIFFDENSVAIKAVGTCQDITDRKKSEHENKFKATLLDTIGQAVMSTDIEGNVNFWNRAAYETYGWTAQEAIGKKIIDLTPSFQTKADAEILISKLSKGESWSGEFFVKRKNGSLFPAYVSNSPVYDEFGKQIGIIGVSSDISERKESELERTKITNDLIQRNRDLEQFTFIISHNLRAPTANIIGFTEYLQDDSLTPEEHKEFLKGLAISVSGLDSVIKDINSILQVKREVNEKKEVISFSKLVNNIFNSIGNLIEKNKVTITHDFDAVDEIFSLKVYLHSIFYNLISNSIKYSNPDVQTIIEIKSQKENEKIILTFKDNGLGFDMKTKGDKVFGLYKRFHSHVEGKGMGLFMVKTQVETLGGKITVSSEVNKGTIFTIIFEN